MRFVLGRSCTLRRCAPSRRTCAAAALRRRALLRWRVRPLRSDASITLAALTLKAAGRWADAAAAGVLL
jgi:hypothetical protein